MKIEKAEIGGGMEQELCKSIDEKLFFALVNERFPTKKDRKIISNALSFIKKLHEEQKREDETPFWLHPARVAFYALLVMSVSDVETVTAALLHDTVEDQSEKLAQMAKKKKRAVGSGSASESEIAVGVVARRFGERTAQMVFALTNPDFESILGERGFQKKDDSYRGEKNRLYLAHVQQIIEEDPRVALIKLCDLLDNVNTISGVKKPEKRIKKCNKYLPVVQLYLELVEKNPLALSLNPEYHPQVCKTLCAAEQHINNLLQNTQVSST
ncbi:HD domain-containing protein [Candidatus Roizmanbacteria bacterium]|nr:HD domain-containing protein [Candidatus Roizmanbacteria bacterium]